MRWPVTTRALINDAVDKVMDEMFAQTEQYLIDEACRMTCREAEAFAFALRDCGRATQADELMEQHARGDDDPEDEHYDAEIQEEDPCEH